MTHPAALEHIKDTPLEQANFSALVKYALNWYVGGSWSLLGQLWIIQCPLRLTE